MKDDKTQIKLGGLFFPSQDSFGKEVPFHSLFVPYIYKEIEFDGIYIDVLNGRTDMTIVDVGANIGIVTHHMIPHARKIYSIEPSPEHFTALKKSKEFNGWNNVEVFNFALADKDGEMSFTQNVYNRTMNTLVVDQEKDEKGDHIIHSGTSAGTMRAAGYDNTITVPTKSIDHFFEENGITHVDFMKFDVEGAEDMILRSEGFRKVAPMIDAIEIEFHFPNWRELVEYLISLGYTARQYECSAIVILFSR